MIGTDPVAARLGQVIQAMEKAVGFDVDLQPTEFVDRAQPRRRRQRSRRSRSAGRDASTRTATSTSFVHYEGHAQRRRLLEPAARPDPRQCPQGDDRQGSERRCTPTRCGSCHRQRPLIYLWHPVQLRRRVEEGRRRADVRRRPDPRLLRRLRAVGSRGATTMGGFLLRKAGAALDRLSPCQRARLRSASGRCPGDPALALGGEDARSRGPRGDPGQVRARPTACPCSTPKWVWARAAGRPRHRPATSSPSRTRS